MSASQSVDLIDPTTYSKDSSPPSHSWEWFFADNTKDPYHQWYDKDPPSTYKRAMRFYLGHGLTQVESFGNKSMGVHYSYSDAKYMNRAIQSLEKAWKNQMRCDLTEETYNALIKRTSPDSDGQSRPSIIIAMQTAENDHRDHFFKEIERLKEEQRVRAEKVAEEKAHELRQRDLEAVIRHQSVVVDEKTRRRQRFQQQRKSVVVE
jgi:hypothetical protein